MTTIAQIIDWIADTRGVFIDRTGHYGAQAPDLVNDYAAELYGLPHIFGHGRNVAGNLIRSHGWKEVGPDQPAEFGDVFSSSGDVINPHGYCGVVVGTRDDMLVVFAQNKNGTGRDPAGIHLYPKADTIEYARPPIRY